MLAAIIENNGIIFYAVWLRQKNQIAEKKTENGRKRLIFLPFLFTQAAQIVYDGIY